MTRRVQYQFQYHTQSERERRSSLRHLAWAALTVAFLETSSVSAQDAQSEDQKASNATADSSLSTVPGQMDSIEQLFSNSPTTEIVEDGTRKDDESKASQSAASKKKTGDDSFAGDEVGSAQSPKKVSDLVNLYELRDIAVIEKRFQPKTKRFEFFGGLNGVLNDKFFTTVGASARVGYAFSERYSIEAIGILFTTSEKQVTEDLRVRRLVFTRSFVTPLNFYGIDFKWTPVYGKMAFVRETITPFDMYFSGGLGMTGTNQDESEPTLHLGTGQSFALTKGISFRWDLSWIFYNATSRQRNSGQVESTYNNLFVTVGMSFLFPEAGYR